MIPINEMPEHSRVWVYQSDRKFSKEEVAKIEQKLLDFISNWATHGTALKASGVILYNQFLVLFADEESVKASGCSIDKSVAFVKQLEKEFSCDFFNRLLVAYKSGEEIKTFHFAEKDELISQGKITESTIIFNNLIQNKSDFLSNWQQRLSESWLN